MYHIPNRYHILYRLFFFGQDLDLTPYLHVLSNILSTHRYLQSMMRYHMEPWPRSCRTCECSKNAFLLFLAKMVIVVKWLSRSYAVFPLLVSEPNDSAGGRAQMQSGNCLASPLEARVDPVRWCKQLRRASPIGGPAAGHCSPADRGLSSMSETTPFNK